MLEEALYRSDMHIGDVFDYPVYGGLNLTLRVKIVGAFKPLKRQDPYWYQGLEGLMNTLQISETVIKSRCCREQEFRFIQQAGTMHSTYARFRTSQLSPLSRTLDRLNIELYQRLKDTKVEISFASTLTRVQKTKPAAADAAVHACSTNDCNGILFYRHECTPIARQAAQRHCGIAKPGGRHAADYIGSIY